MTDTPTPPTEPATPEAPPTTPDDGKTWAETLHDQSYGNDYDNDKDVQVPVVDAPAEPTGTAY